MLRRKRKWDKSFLILGLIIAIVLASAVVGYLELRTDQLSESLQKGRPISFLFAVSGDRDYRFFEVLQYHPQTHRGAVLFLPGNVGLILESLRKVDRMDAVYHYGSIGALKSKVEQITGLSIPYYFELRERDVVSLVDLLGGLELFVPNPVEASVGQAPAGQAPAEQASAAGQTKVLLPSGSVLLDGDKIRDFISYRDPLEPETEWVGRKQKFLQATLKALADSDLALQPTAFAALRRIVSTNLSARSLAAFIREMKKLESEKLIFQRVLGSTREVDGKELLFPHFDGQLLKEVVKQSAETIASAEPGAEEQLTVALEILNGTSVTGLAKRAASVFQSYGYDVVALANADNAEYLNTVVLDRKGRLEAAQKVAELIRCRRVHSQLPEGGDQTIDVTVILGRDFDGRYCKD
jgi:anionic cell wall polymer biosynthesis LytR-Cps2A-Psr (LCP) family protein